MPVDARAGEAAAGAALALTGVALAASAAGMPSGSLALPGPGFVPLAVGMAGGSAPRIDAVTDLAAGDTIVLFTDGLVERRRRSLDDGLADLRAVVVGGAATQSVEAIADLLIRELGAAAADDDVALVVYRADGAD